MDNNFNNNSFKDISCNSFIDLLLSLNETELTLFACILGFYIASISTVNQQNSIGNFFELIGQVLLTINAQNVNLNQTNMLNKKIEQLEKELNEIKKKFYK